MMPIVPPDRDRCESDRQRDARAVEQAREDVATQRVGTEEEDPTVRTRRHRIREPEHEVLPIWIERGEPATEDRCDGRDAEEHDGEDRPARRDHDPDRPAELAPGTGPTWMLHPGRRHRLQLAHPRPPASFTRGSRRT